jgi:hypothetical protein
MIKNADIMGVTIHFEGRLKTPAVYSAFLDELRDYAVSHSWPCETIFEQQTILKRVRDEQAWDYSGPTFGLQLLPDPNADPLRFEFDKDYRVQEYVKTQFAGVDTHVAIIGLLRRIQPFFECLTVEDEGEFWATSEESVLATHIQKCNEVLKDLLEKNPGAKGPVRLPNGRIVDYMS